MGCNATYKGWGLGYHKTYYGDDVIHSDPVYGDQKSKQNVGGIDVFFNYNSLTIENDYFAFENNGMGNRYDRWRSNAIEYRGQNGLIVGTHLFNNNPEGNCSNGIACRDKNGESKIWGRNKGAFGAWKHGVTYSSPFYVGYRYGNHIDKIGWDHGIFQDLTQNFIHKYAPTHQNFYNQYVDDYSRPYFYSGYYNQYSIWGR